MVIAQRCQKPVFRRFKPFLGVFTPLQPLVSTVIKKNLWYDTSPNKLQPAHKFLRIFINRYVTGMHFGEHSFAFFGIFCRNGQKELSWKFGTFFVDSGTPKMVRKDNVDDYTFSTRSIAIILEF